MVDFPVSTLKMSLKIDSPFLTIILLLVSLFLIFLYPLFCHAESVPEYIATTAKEYGVDPQLALYISYKESQWNPNAIGDHGTSFGVFQIHNPESKGLTPTQAKNLIISTKWAMQELAQGKCYLWSTCPD